MKKIINLENIKRFFSSIFVKLFKINDTPQKIALGFGLGAFLGILPGTGPLVALFLAAIFKINKASALLGSLLTNTWLSFVTFLLALKIGAFIMGKDFSQTRLAILAIIKDFHFKNLLNVSIFEVILPLLVGFAIVSFLLGVVVYLVTLIIIKQIRRKN